MREAISMLYRILRGTAIVKYKPAPQLVGYSEGAKGIRPLAPSE